MSLEKRIEKLELQTRSKNEKWVIIRAADKTDEEIEEIKASHPDVNVIITNIRRPKDWGPAVL